MAWLHEYAVLLFYLLPCIAFGALPFQENGVVTSSNGTFKYVGDSLELYCNITNKLFRENSSLLHFEKGQRNFSPFVETLTTKTIRMRLSNLSIHDDGTYTCYLNVFTGTPKVIGSQIIRVDYKPQKVKDISCRVYNWEEMTCTWDLGVKYKHLKFINVSLTWTIHGDQLDCPHLKEKTSCHWNTSDYTNGHHYYMVIEVSTVLENGTKLMTEMSPTFRVETQLYEISENDTSETSVDKIFKKAFVEPAPVANLKASAINSSCVELSWQHSAQNRDKFFMAAFQIAGETKWDQIILPEYGKKEKSFQFLACGLNPFTLYKFNMSVLPLPVHTVKPVNQGHRSQFETTTAKTLEDVPGSAPKICKGCFYQLKCLHNESLHCFQLYWQDLNEKDKNGIITEYNIIYTSIETGIGNSLLLQVTESKPVTSATLKLPTVSQNYKISIRPATSQGSSRRSSVLFLPSIMRRPNAPQGFLVERDQKKEGKDAVFYLKWEKLNVDAKTGHIYTNVTIVWCHGSRQETECKGAIHWVELPADVVTYELKPESKWDQDGDLLIGITAEISSEDQSVSSGIHWSTCTYLLNEPPQNAPKNVIESLKHPTNGLTILWDKYECSEEKSFITKYLVTYCPSQDGNKCTGDEMLQTVPNSDGWTTIENLKEDERYRVIVTAVSSAGNKSTEPILTVAVKSAPAGLDVTVVIAAIAGCFIFVLILIILILLWRYCNNRRKKLPHRDGLIQPYAQTTVDYPIKTRQGFQNRPLPKTPEEQHYYGLSACMNNHGFDRTKDKDNSGSYYEEFFTLQSNPPPQHAQRNHCFSSSDKSKIKQDSTYSVSKEERSSTKEETPLLDPHLSGNIQNPSARVHSSKGKEPEIGSAGQLGYCTLGCTYYSNENHDIAKQTPNLVEESGKCNSSCVNHSSSDDLNDYHLLSLSSSRSTNPTEVANSSLFNFSNTDTLPLRGHKVEIPECRPAIAELQEMDELASSVLVSHGEDQDMGQHLDPSTPNNLADIPSHQMNKSSEYVAHPQIGYPESDFPLNNDPMNYTRFVGSPLDQRYSDSFDSSLNNFSTSSPPSPCPGDTHMTSGPFSSPSWDTALQPLHENQFCMPLNNNIPSAEPAPLHENQFFVPLNNHIPPEPASFAHTDICDINGYKTFGLSSSREPANDQSHLSTNITAASDESTSHNSFVPNISSGGIYVDKLPQ